MLLDCAMRADTSLDIFGPLHAGMFQCQLAVTATVPEARFLSGTRAVPPGGPRRRHSMSTAEFSATSFWDRRAELPGLAATAVSPSAAVMVADSPSPWLSARDNDSLQRAGPAMDGIPTCPQPAATCLRALSAEGVSQVSERRQVPVKVGLILPELLPSLRTPSVMEVSARQWRSAPQIFGRIAGPGPGPVWCT